MMQALINERLTTLKKMRIFSLIHWIPFQTHGFMRVSPATGAGAKAKRKEKRRWER